MKTNFQRAKLMLDAMMQAMPGNGPAAVTQEILSLAGRYPGIWNVAAQPIDYSKPATQAAYVFSYLGANADLIYQTLWGARAEATSLLSQHELRIASVGGGPGSDLLGLIKFVERLPTPPKSLYVELLDHHTEWTSVWEHTLSTLPAGMTCLPRLTKLDFEKKGSWVANYDFLQSDVFIFSYSLSEVWRYNSGGSVSEFVDLLINNCRTGALFIYSDNSGENFDPHFEKEFYGRPELRLLYRKAHDGVLISSDEQASDLEPYRTTFGRSPKLKGKATCAALVKI